MMIRRTFAKFVFGDLNVDINKLNSYSMLKLDDYKDHRLLFYDDDKCKYQLI